MEIPIHPSIARDICELDNENGKNRDPITGLLWMMASFETEFLSSGENWDCWQAGSSFSSVRLVKDPILPELFYQRCVYRPSLPVAFGLTN